MHNLLRLSLLSLSLLSAPLYAETINVGEFSKQQLGGWSPQKFSGQTQYQFQTINQQTLLQANSQASASGLVRKLRIDLQKTPILNWSWRIDNTLPGLNEQSKAGDDYAARLYVVVDGGLLKWNSKAVNYVWSSNQVRGASWNNAYLPDNAKMIAVRGKQDKAGGLVREKRNVAADFKRLYGADIRYIDAIAIMTDTDNSKGKASAAYGDIFFSAQ